MTRLATLTTTLGLALLATGAHAQSMYGELGYTGLDYKQPGLKASPGMVRGLVGYEFTPQLAVEGMLGLGANADTTDGTRVKLDNTLGVYGKAQLPLTDAFKLYGRVGVARNSVKLGGSADSHTTGLAYGAGMSYDLSKTSYLSVDYMRYQDKDSKTLEGITAGIGVRF